MKIFCDLDGTLLDVSVRHYMVYSELAVKFLGKALEKDEYWKLKRKKVSWQVILSMSGISESRLDEFLNDFMVKIEDVDYLRVDRLFPYSVETLEYISGKYDCYLVSLRRNMKNLQAELEWLGIKRYFKYIFVGHSDNDGSDVKTELISKILKGEHGYIIGDTEADILTGQTLSLQTVAVLSGIRDEKFLTELNPDYIVAGIQDIKTIL